VSEEIKLQRNYWNRESESFDRIYSGGKSKLSLILDKYFRQDMFERFAFTLHHSEPAAGKTFLDVGCGTGLYSVELAKKGAQRVLGIDIAENMLDRCRQLAAKEHVEQVCRFAHTDLLELEASERFNVTIGIGLFDYISDALPVLRKMREVSTDKVIVSFPRFWTWRAPVRKLRLALRGCPVYFFTRRRIAALLKEAGFARHTVKRVGKLHCVVAYPEAELKKPLTTENTERHPDDL